MVLLYNILFDANISMLLGDVDPLLFVVWAEVDTPPAEGSGFWELIVILDDFNVVEMSFMVG